MAIFYIDPSASTNGTGTVESPYNTWVGVTLTANNIYRQKRGTTYTGATVRATSRASDAATPLTIEAYFHPNGSDDDTQPRPVINHNGGTNGIGAVFIDTCSHVIVRNIVGTNSNGALGGGVTVRRSQNVQIRNCVGNFSEHGFLVQQDQAAATSTCTDIVIDGCIAHNNVSGGITFRWGAASTAVLRRITITNNLIYGNGTGKNVGSGGSTVPCGGITSYSVFKSSTDVNYRNYDIIVERNTVRDNLGYGINVEMADNDAATSSVSYNEVSGSGISGDVDSHSLWVGNCFDTVIEGNYVHDNFANSGTSTGTGIGIFVDYNGSSTTGGSGCIVRMNLVENQFSGTTTGTAEVASAGIYVLYNDDTLVQGNIVRNCRNGIAVGGFSQALNTGNKIYNNTIINTALFGLTAAASVNTELKNNLIVGGTYGIFSPTSGMTNLSSTNNNVANCTIPRATGTATSPTVGSLDATDRTIDPVVDPRGKPTRPQLFSRGADVGGVDFYGNSFPSSPSIGAIQCVGTYPRANFTSYQAVGAKEDFGARR
jgi:hypothetical protein